MKKIVFLILGLAVAFPAWSMQFEAKEKIMIDRSRLCPEDFYIAGEQVTFEGTALQDLLIAASSQAVVAGTVMQDLNVACINQAEIRAEVDDDLRVLASEIIISGRVNGSTLAGAKQFWLYRQGTLQKDAVIWAGEVHLSGLVGGTLNVQATKVVIDGILLGDVFLRAESIQVTKNAQILGRLEYDAKKEPEIESGALVKQIARRPTSLLETANIAAGNQAADNWQSLMLAGNILYRFTLFIGLLFCGILLIVMLPQPIRHYALAIKQSPWANVGWGLLTGFCIILLLLVLVISVVGIPFAIIFSLLTMLLMMGAGIASGYLIGILLLKPQPDAVGKSIGAFALGFTLLSALGLIPWLGGFINLAVIILGLGAIWQVKNFREAPAMAGVPPIEKPAMNETLAGEPALAEPQQVLASADEDKIAEPRADWRPAVPAFRQQTEPEKPSTRRKKVPAGKIKIKPKTVKKNSSKRVVKKITKRSK